MSGLLLVLFLFQIGPRNAGIVTGTVRGANGAPAAGVRVYAIATRDAVEQANGPTALESQTETDASGKYRLEVQAGRYYIASGSVAAPTYYPGTTEPAMARAVTITAGGLVEGVDFSSFVPASRRPAGLGFGPALPPGSTGVVAGVIRFPDGTPASGIVVSASTSTATTTSSAVPLALLRGNFTTVIQGSPVSSLLTLTDVSGRYRIQSLPPDTYYIAAGVAEALTIYPGTSDVSKATTITTTATTKLENLDFTISPLPAAIPVSGRVTATGGLPASGVTVLIRPRVNVSSQTRNTTFGLPSGNLAAGVTTRADGSFEFAGALPGTYTLETNYPGIPPIIRDIEVVDQPISGLELSIQASVFSGRVLLEDNSVPPDVQTFGEAIVTAGSNPSMVTSFLVPIAPDGTFARILRPGEYRFSMRTLPEEYTMKSVPAGAIDLLQERLKVTGKEPIHTEVRIARRTTPVSRVGVAVSGKVIDSVSGSPAAAERVTICCFASGLAERLSAPLYPDGTFEFADVPSGHYILGLERRSGQTDLYTVPALIDVANQPLAGLTFASTSGFGPLAARILLEDGRSLPAGSPASVVFTGAGGRTRVQADHEASGRQTALLPVGDRYEVSVENLPEGYVVKSVEGSTEVQPGMVGSGQPITITLAPAAPPR